MNRVSSTNWWCVISCAVVVALSFCTATVHHALAATDGPQEIQQMLQEFDRAAVSLQNSEGESLVAFNQQQPMVPASTVKLLTGLMSIDHWGESFRATTDFYFDKSTSALTVAGNGDPFLVSEEIEQLAAELQAALVAQGVTGLKAIRVNNARFKKTSGLSWQSTTSNPYDAVPSALAANFSTLNVKVENGVAVSNEEQTPLTRFAWQWIAQQPGVKKTSEVDKQTGQPLLEPPSIAIGRINTGPDVDLAARYFGELLASFLWHEGIAFFDGSGVAHQSSGEENRALPLAVLADSVRVDAVTQGELIYTHRNSRPISDVVAAMLKYSTNFIANNLALMLASHKTRKPAGFDEFRKIAEAYAKQRFAWQDIVLQEGAGLSLANRLSAAQLVQLVEAYNSRQDLLPVYKESEFGRRVFAKTGSLKGVSTLAGFIKGTSGATSAEDYPFAILLQDDSIVDSRSRDKILQLMIDQIE